MSDGLLVERQAAIVALGDACRAIAEAKAVPEIKLIRDQAQAFLHFARERALGLETILDAAEIKIRAERRMGELLSEMPRQEKGRPGKCSTMEHFPTLSELGTTRQDSHRWQKVYSVPLFEIERYIASCRGDGVEPTTAAVLRLAAKAEPEDDRFCLLTECKAIHAWLEARRKGWPDVGRPQFFTIVRNLLDRMEADHACGGEGEEVAGAGGSGDPAGLVPDDSGGGGPD